MLVYSRSVPLLGWVNQINSDCNAHKTREKSILTYSTALSNINYQWSMDFCVLKSRYIFYQKSQIQDRKEYHQYLESFTVGSVIRVPNQLLYPIMTYIWINVGSYMKREQFVGQISWLQGWQENLVFGTPESLFCSRLNNSSSSTTCAH